MTKADSQVVGLLPWMHHIPRIEDTRRQEKNSSAMLVGIIGEKLLGLAKAGSKEIRVGINTCGIIADAAVPVMAIVSEIRPSPSRWRLPSMRAS